MRNRRLLLLLPALSGAVLICLLVLIAGFVIEVHHGLSVAETVYLNLWLSSQEDTLNQPVGFNATPVVFVVNSGDTAEIIGTNLQNQGLISNAEVFRNYARYNGLDSQLEAGTYFVANRQTIPEIAVMLTDSSKASVTVRILEGWRREEIADAIDNNPYLTFSGAEFLAGTGPDAVVATDFLNYTGIPLGATLEGFLYPDTYFLPPTTSALEFRDTLLRTFVERIDAATRMAIEQQGLTIFQAVIFASIVDREAVIEAEQPQIASVYLNRFRIGMNLDADPTVQYGIGYRDGAWWPSITMQDYRTANSPYNTYLYNGLPPGPIANPSLNAIRSVAYPSVTDYFYFRADCSGSGYHVFAKTFDEHVANGNCQ